LDILEPASERERERAREPASEGGREAEIEITYILWHWSV
jgi:hypothetical protein